MGKIHRACSKSCVSEPVAAEPRSKRPSTEHPTAKCHIYVGNICERIRIIKLNGHTKALRPLFCKARFIYATVNWSQVDRFYFIQNNISFLAQLCSCNDWMRFKTWKYFFSSAVLNEQRSCFISYNVLFIFGVQRGMLSAGPASPRGHSKLKNIPKTGHVNHKRLLFD